MPIPENIASSFVSFLRQFVPLTDAEVKKELLPIINVREFPKKHVITTAGEVENYMNFIHKGLIRKYYKTGDDEHIVQLSIEGHLISSQESFYTRTPSEYFVETIEPAVLISLTYEDMERLFASSHSFERLGRLVTVHTMVLKDRWQTSLIMQQPRERFLNFVSHYQEILQRVPQKYLASYLNIKPETFSRFKHLLRTRRTV
ncbi:Crp/Fnr family transcriptional regulator [Niabella insulamsoli]|uniref:Crp/Fnr family transcriptional regulator n=1 Tax=Niabella insulamsoli TaxID=3144874 RepID=UPI0031FD5F4F